MKIIVKSGQNLFDITLIAQGDIEAVFEIAKLNNISVSDILFAGSEIKVPAHILNKNITEYYKNNNIEPATGITTDDTEFIITNVDESIVTDINEQIITNRTEL